MFSKIIFAERIRNLRISKNIKQEDLGIAVGLKKSAICMIEKGERAASIDVLYALSEYFSVSTDYLLGLTDNPVQNK